MTIGGCDRVLPFRWGPVNRDLILRFLHHVWPEGVYEDAHDTYASSIPEARSHAPRSDEFFIYVSQTARAAWEAEGATSATNDTMLHFIGGDAITVVFDEPDSALAKVVEELADVVARNRFGIDRPRKAA